MSSRPNPSQPGNDPRPGSAIARQVRSQGVTDERVIEALSGLSRERFLPPKQRTHATEDRALPIGFEQTISQPLMVAVMSAELGLTGTERVLEIGTGSGYQTALLSVLAAEVYTVERLETLSLRARGVLDGLGRTNIRYRIGDGSLGWPEAAPFDRVLVTAGAPAFPRALFGQLREQGILVAPLGPSADQDLIHCRKQDGKPVRRIIMSCRFVKLIGAEGWAEE
jgi:protein-L-isoaspartate(D-aspartate) O-methyltransferase